MVKKSRSKNRGGKIKMDTKLEIIMIISVAIYFAVIWQDLMIL